MKRLIIDFSGRVREDSEPLEEIVVSNKNESFQHILDIAGETLDGEKEQYGKEELKIGIFGMIKKENEDIRLTVADYAFPEDNVNLDEWTTFIKFIKKEDYVKNEEQ